ncbi:fructose-bisphosphatase class II family protein [Rubrobacter aplysinae]|uniref:fructose-bisphosphatase class II family protein n=1 Tax=Rubrobacter aplysinae TaxID=909625 RepID=UPI00064BF68A|nr:fructose-bisphosphatase class II family protein [Rubrobacter aplysinae]
MSTRVSHENSIGDSAIQYASVTEQVALTAGRQEGAGSPEETYTQATEAFKRGLGGIPNSCHVAILREERLDESGSMKPLKLRSGILGVGDKLGAGGAEVDVAVEPVEGMQLLTKGQPGSIAAVAVAPEGSMLQVPDMYMSKIIVGPRAKGCIDIDAPVEENVRAIADALSRKPSEMTVAVLDRERHEGLIEDIRKTGARIQIRAEGDLTPAIDVGVRGSELHAVIGIGGAPEGILASAVIRCLGGEMQARMWPTQRSQVEMLKERGMDDLEKKLTLDDMIQSEEVVFAATGITAGDTLKSVRYFRGGGRTHTLVMSTKPRVIRFLDTIHALEPEAGMQGFQL